MKVTDYHDVLSNSLLFVSILLLFKLIEHHSNHRNSPLSSLHLFALNSVVMSLANIAVLDLKHLLN